METTKEGEDAISYVCIKCGEAIPYKHIAASPEIKCPNCGYRVLKKIRPPIVKVVKAR
jgi:DNA-directed RNA polymerase subunit P